MRPCARRTLEAHGLCVALFRARWNPLAARALPFEGAAVSRCVAISDAGHVVCHSPDYEHPFIALIDFGGS